MKTIRCKCGKRILMLPELKRMSKAIENHVAEHRTKMLMQGANRIAATVEGVHIRHLLPQQVLSSITTNQPRRRKTKRK